MQRKGSHVDWAISLGIFTIYTLLAIIFLRPGLQETAEPTALLDLVEQKLKEDTFYTLEKTPLFITLGNGVSTGGDYTADIRDSLAAFDGKSENYALTYPHLSYVSADISIRKGGEDRLRFEGFLAKNTKNLFVVLNSSHVNYLDPRLYGSLPSSPLPPRTLPNTGPCPLSVPPDPQPCLSYELGSTEKLTGVSLSRLDSVAGETYEALRGRWNFPKGSVSFSFSVYESGSRIYDPQGDLLKEFNPRPSTAQGRIFVREFRAFILTPNGGLSPVIINLRVGDLA